MKIEEARKHILDWIEFATNPDTLTSFDEPCTDEEILEAMRVAAEAMSPSSTTRWKPSEEQMEALSDTLEFMPDTFKPRCTLVTLQNDLKELM